MRGSIATTSRLLRCLALLGGLVSLSACSLDPVLDPFQRSRPNLGNRTPVVYSFPTVLPKRKPTAPEKPLDTIAQAGVVSDTPDVSHLLPKRLVLPKRNPRRRQTVASSTVTPQLANSQPAAPQPVEPVPAQSPVTNPVIDYRVQPGDTVYSISRTKRVSIREMITLNGLRSPYTLRVGQVLKLPIPKQHTVIAGDTLYSISRLYKVDTTELVRLNRIKAPYAIYVGQKLRLPATQSTAHKPAPQPTQTASLPKASTVQPPPSAPSRPLNKSGPVPSPASRAGSGFLYPVQGKIISAFGTKSGGIHNDGINIASERGTPIVAAENGVVVYAGNELKGFGQMLLVKHADGWLTAYAHADRLYVGRGDQVKRGQQIATVGQSGNVSTPQLHFEIRKGAEAVNPTEYLKN